MHVSNNVKPSNTDALMLLTPGHNCGGRPFVIVDLIAAHFILTESLTTFDVDISQARVSRCVSAPSLLSREMLHVYDPDSRKY